MTMEQVSSSSPRDSEEVSVQISGQEEDYLIKPSTPKLKDPSINSSNPNSRLECISQFAALQYLVFRLFTILCLLLVTAFLGFSFIDFRTDKETIIQIPFAVSPEDQNDQSVAPINPLPQLEPEDFQKFNQSPLPLLEPEDFQKFNQSPLPHLESEDFQKFNQSPLPHLEPEDFQKFNQSPIPLVLWHGMGDTAVGIKFGLRFISEEIPGIYIKSLQFGSNPVKDMENGYFLNANSQIETACNTIRNDPKLANGFNAIGVSQGGQFLRGLVQRCTGLNVFNLISLGGQHQGIFGVPKCSAPKKSWCEIIDKLLTHLAYESWVQNFLVQAEYWHDPFSEKTYVESSVFLADINNERNVNTTYRRNLLLLKNLILLKFDGDTIVQPKETEWFGFFQNNTDKAFFTLEESSLYKEDKIGLKELNDSGRLHLLSVPGDHLEFSKEWFVSNILKPYLL